jgi:hypothetical protein
LLIFCKQDFPQHSKIQNSQISSVPAISLKRPYGKQGLERGVLLLNTFSAIFLKETSFKAGVSNTRPARLCGPRRHKKLSNMTKITVLGAVKSVKAPFTLY